MGEYFEWINMDNQETISNIANKILGKLDMFKLLMAVQGGKYSDATEKLYNSYIYRVSFFKYEYVI